MVEDRIRAALREIVATGATWERPARRRRPSAALAGLAVAAIVAVVALLPGWTGEGSRPVAAGGRPTLPETFPAYAFGQGTSQGPFGRAIAMYHNGTGHEDWTFSQLIVAGADRNSVRRLPVSAVRQGGGIEARLGPDGTKVMVGGRGTIGVIDLMTGTRREYPASTAAFTAPLAVSRDGGRVAFAAYSQFPEEGTLFVLDLETGQVSPPLGADVTEVAFGPDRMLATQVGHRVRIHEWTGVVRGEFDLPDDTELAGPQAWTPDGGFLVTVHTGPSRYEGSHMRQGPRSFGFVPMSETPAPQPIPADDLLPRAWGDPVLGWRSPTTMLVSGGDVDGTTSNLIQEVEIATGAHRIISRFRVGPNDDLAVGDVQLATGLLAEMGMRSGANPDRGPWPTWLIIAVVLCLAPGALTYLLTRPRLSR